MDGGPTLLAAVKRAAATPKSRLALVLHLSRLPPPGAKTYQRRVVRAIFRKAAAEYEGQVFEVSHGDHVLLCRALVGGDPTVHPCALAPVFQRLFHTAPGQVEDLTNLWWLERQSTDLLSYAASC